MSGESTPPDLEGSAQRFGDALNTQDLDAVASSYAPDAAASFGRFAERR